MIINDNLMNPVPLWPSKDNWYSKKATNHGACAHPVLPTGLLSAMMLTIPYQDPLPSCRQMMFARLSVDEGRGRIDVIGEINNNVIVTFDGTSVDINNYNIAITPSGKEEKYAAYLTLPGSRQPIPFMPYASIDDLRGGVVLNTTAPLGEPIYYLELRIDITVVTDLTWHLYKIGNDTPLFSQSHGELVELVPFNNRTNKRYATINIDERAIVGNFDDGEYYCTMTDDDGVTHYTEPFMWLTDLERHLPVTYRRSKPIVIGDNYIPFVVDGSTKSLTMYLPGRLMMPPFKFDVDIEEIDGMKYARKQVSYTQEHVEFHCTSYFAQAIRLLWHCDIRYARLSRIDYMEPPQVDWKDDNHLCDVVLEFQCDTVMQTNGMASAYDDSSDSGHASYDMSFDQSFS